MPGPLTLVLAGVWLSYATSTQARGPQRAHDSRTANPIGAL